MLEVWVYSVERAKKSVCSYLGHRAVINLDEITRRRIHLQTLVERKSRFDRLGSYRMETVSFNESRLAGLVLRGGLSYALSSAFLPT